MKWEVVYSKQALKDAKKLIKSNLKVNAQLILEQLEYDPFSGIYKALVGELKGSYSRRINIQDRVVYQVLTDQKIVKVLRMWTHYGD